MSKSRRRVEKLTEPPYKPPFFIELREEKWNSRLTDQSKVFYCSFFWLNLRLFTRRKKLSKHFDHDFVSEISNTGGCQPVAGFELRASTKFFLMKRKISSKASNNGCWSLIDSLNTERPAVWLDSFRSNRPLSPRNSRRLYVQRRVCPESTST